MKTLSLLGLFGAALLLSGCLEATLVEQRPVHRRPVVYHDGRHNDGRYYDSRRTYYRQPEGRSGYYRHRDDDRDVRNYHYVHDDDDDDIRRKQKSRVVIVRPGYY